MINKLFSYLFKTTLFLVIFPQVRQTLSPRNASASPSLISPGDRIPKVIIVAKTAFPFGADHHNELPKAISWTTSTARFKLDELSAVAIITGHGFVVSKDVFSLVFGWWWRNVSCQHSEEITAMQLPVVALLIRVTRSSHRALFEPC